MADDLDPESHAGMFTATSPAQKGAEGSGVRSRAVTRLEGTRRSFQRLYPLGRLDSAGGYPRPARRGGSDSPATADGAALGSTFEGILGMKVTAGSWALGSGPPPSAPRCRRQALQGEVARGRPSTAITSSEEYSDGPFCGRARRLFLEGCTRLDRSRSTESRQRNETTSQDGSAGEAVSQSGWRSEDC